jgi:hypothetical protein
MLGSGKELQRKQAADTRTERLLKPCHKAYDAIASILPSHLPPFLPRKGSVLLTDSTPAPVRAPVWLVLFDPLPGIQSDVPSAAFETLEVQSLVFEQYLIQDLRESATLDDYLGGAVAVTDWARALSLPPHAVVWLQLGQIEATAFSGALQPAIFSLSHDLSAAATEHLLSTLKPASLVLVTVRSDADPANVAEIMKTADAALSRLKTLAETVYGTSESPVWLVTGLRGVSRQLQQPFESGADESLMHVPVWWREPSSAGTRLQSLCGSFDLLPTLAELLTTDGAASTAVAPEPLADGPLSLLSPQLQGTEGAARLLRIHHDAWLGFRTSQYFLLQPIETVTDEADDTDEAAGRRLYLKPDDYWNLNNCIVSYGEIAREMANGS